MKCKVFVSGKVDTLEMKINKFLEDVSSEQLKEVHFSTCQAYDSDSEFMDFTYSALITYE